MEGKGVGILTLDPRLEVGVRIRQTEKVCMYLCLCFLGRTKQDDKERSRACSGNCKYINSIRLLCREMAQDEAGKVCMSDL